MCPFCFEAFPNLLRHVLGIGLGGSVNGDDATVNTAATGEASGESLRTGNLWKIMKVDANGVSNRGDAITKLQIRLERLIIIGTGHFV